MRVTIGLLILCTKAMATLPVIDYAHISQDAGNQVVNLAKYAQTAVATAQTEINTLNTYENTILQVARMGNPAALRAIPGVSTIGELVSMYAQVNQDYMRMQGLINPSRYQYDLNSIMSAYSQPSWNGFTSASGLPVLPAQGLYQFQTSNYAVGQAAQQQLAQLEQNKIGLTQQRDATIKSLQAATTVSDVQKYTAILQGLNAAIADVNQSENQLAERARLQQQQNNAAQQIYQNTQYEKKAAQDYQGVDHELDGLPVNDFHKGIYLDGTPAQ